MNFIEIEGRGIHVSDTLVVLNPLTLGDETFRDQLLGLVKKGSKLMRKKGVMQLRR